MRELFIADWELAIDDCESACSYRGGGGGGEGDASHASHASLWIRPLLIREVPISEGACVMDGTVGKTLLSGHPFNQDTACS